MLEQENTSILLIPEMTCTNPILLIWEMTCTDFKKIGERKGLSALIKTTDHNLSILFIAKGSSLGAPLVECALFYLFCWLFIIFIICFRGGEMFI